jgi:hypothetical protein
MNGYNFIFTWTRNRRDKAVAAFAIWDILAMGV